MNSRKPTCGPGLLQRLVRRLGRYQNRHHGRDRAGCVSACCDSWEPGPPAPPNITSTNDRGDMPGGSSGKTMLKSSTSTSPLYTRSVEPGHPYTATDPL